MNYEFYNLFAFSRHHPLPQAQALLGPFRGAWLKLEDRTKKRLRLPTRMRRRAIFSFAINSIAVVTASLDRRRLLLPLVFRLHPSLMLFDFARCELIPVDLHAYWHEANGAFLNVPSEDLDVLTPPTSISSPRTSIPKSRTPVSSVRVSSPSPTSPSVLHVSAPVVAIPEPVTEVDSVHLDHCERALDTCRVPSEHGSISVTTTSSPSNFVAEGEGNVDDGTGEHQRQQA
ncbi:hypothetical protein B0H14DRAFT_192861 [Mycena olivaceomarginata]|nr:hypothetical protein B0H14DRAFT_192861 [Mycena olivaceomarginata]